MAHTHRSRIVFLIDSLRMGGAERLLSGYLQHLDTSRFEARVCALDVRDGNPIADDIRRLGIPTDLIPVRKLRDISAVPRLVRYLRQKQTDLLHTQLEAADTLGTTAARILGIPIVSTLHTLEEPRKGSRIHWRLTLRWWLLRHFCDRVISVSEEARQHYLRRGELPPDKVITLHNGVDLDRFAGVSATARLSGRQAFGIPLDAPLLITVAVLRQPKGIQYLIEALPSILAAIPTVRYLVAGSGDYEGALKELVKTLGLVDHVIFSGARSDIPDLLAMSDLFVLPTLGEALPTVLAEAMAAQKPIIASNVGGVLEMVEHGRNGLLVPPADPARLVEACLHLLQNPAQAQAMGRAGRQIVEQHFDIRKQVQCLSDLYQETLAKRGKWRD
jgi:glycosyltransferase involved in cell wall biosynthesis